MGEVGASLGKEGSRAHMHARGLKSTSFSCGYCEIQSSSHPRSTMPICISKSSEGLPGCDA